MTLTILPMTGMLFLCYIWTPTSNSHARRSQLPSGVFRDCEFERFDDASTNAAVLRLDIPDYLKALLTVLRKLYLQAGGGRKVEALRRGLPGRKISDLIDPVVAKLESEKMVAITEGVAHPIRRHTGRVMRILAAGALSNDPLIEAVREIGEGS
jgi:hypothetical protein